MPKTDITVQLTGEDGNAFAIVAKVSSALKRAGYKELAEEYRTEAIKGDYDHLLKTTVPDHFLPEVKFKLKTA